LLLAAALILSGCGRLLSAEGQPIPGPTPSGTPTGTGTGIPASPEEGADTVTEGPGITG
jgi:hypothetical protein